LVLTEFIDIGVFPFHIMTIAPIKVAKGSGCTRFLRMNA
jgi:hypothetical protein